MSARLIAGAHAARVQVDLPAGYRANLSGAQVAALEREACAIAHDLCATTLRLEAFRSTGPRQRWAWPYVQDLGVTLEGDEGSGEAAAEILRAAWVEAFG